MVDVRRTARLLGGSKVLERRIETPIDLHEVLERGLSLQSLQYFAEHRRHITTSTILNFVLGRRRKAHPWLPVRLGRHQTNRLFVFADALATASENFRSMIKAERWLMTPLAALEMCGRRPMDLLSTPVGEKIVANEITEADLMSRVERAAEKGMKDIDEGRYTVIRNKDELREFVEGISQRVARRHRSKVGRTKR